MARRCVGKRSYKTDAKKKQTLEHQQARTEIIEAIANTTDATSSIRRAYGFVITVKDQLVRDAVEDGTGDKLDAILCAIQAGWAYNRRDLDYGMRMSCDPLEGWIADPSLVVSKAATA